MATFTLSDSALWREYSIALWLIIDCQRASVHPDDYVGGHWLLMLAPGERLRRSLAPGLPGSHRRRRPQRASRWVATAILCLVTVPWWLGTAWLLGLLH